MSVIELYLRRIDPHHLRVRDKVYVIDINRKNMILVTAAVYIGHLCLEYSTSLWERFYMKRNSYNVYFGRNEIEFEVYAVIFTPDTNTSVTNGQGMSINTISVTGTPEVQMTITQKYAKDIEIGDYITISPSLFNPKLINKVQTDDHGIVEVDTDDTRFDLQAFQIILIVNLNFDLGG
jgi:hypothetical protein